jgi:hypothetical protein
MVAEKIGAAVVIVGGVIAHGEFHLLTLTESYAGNVKVSGRAIVGDSVEQ